MRPDRHKQAKYVLFCLLTCGKIRCNNRSRQYQKKQGGGGGGGGGGSGNRQQPRPSNGTNVSDNEEGDEEGDDDDESDDENKPNDDDGDDTAVTASSSYSRRKMTSNAYRYQSVDDDGDAELNASVEQMLQREAKALRELLETATGDAGDAATAAEGARERAWLAAKVSVSKANMGGAWTEDDRAAANDEQIYQAAFALDLARLGTIYATMPLAERMGLGTATAQWVLPPAQANIEQTAAPLAAGGVSIAKPLPQSPAPVARPAEQAKPRPIPPVQAAPSQPAASALEDMLDDILG